MIIISTRAAQKAETITPDQQQLVKPWLSFCRDRHIRRASVYVDYDNGSNPSRWTYKERVRKFTVKSAQTLEILTSSTTLEGALRLARPISESREAFANQLKG